jgi:hypothetical protein
MTATSPSTELHERAGLRRAVTLIGTLSGA